MSFSSNPGYRAAAIGVGAAALIVGAFSLGATRGTTSSGQPGSSSVADLTSSSSPSGHITVTGNGTVTGTPNQLVLSLGVQLNGASVSSALSQANRAVNRVTAALRDRGVAASEIQTSDLNIQPNYQGNSQVPTSYGASESITVTLNNMSQAGRQIDAAVNAGGNAVTVNGVSVNLTDTSGLLAAARAKAVADARTQARQYAAALGEPLGQVISITPVPQQPQYPEVFDNVQASASIGKASVPVSPGSQQLTVSITVVFAT
jgi:uncharacterized protein YggE